MKKKFGLFALVLAVLLCGSLFLLAACDETEEDPADTPATISVTVNGTAQTSGGTYSATVGTAYTFAATASNGNAVTISYVFGDAEAEELEGTSFTPETAGSYAFTFTAEDATNFTLTLVAAEAEVPQPATISVTVNGTAQTSGGTYSATVGTAYTFAATASNGNAVTISYVFGDAEAETLNGTSFTPETAGSYAFTFTAEGATSFTLTLVATEAETPQPATISVTVNGTAQTNGGTYDATVGTAYTFAATASNGNAVTISYVFGDAAAEELNGTSFTPETAGSYAFTFTAEGATSFTLTLVATEAEVPPATQYTVTYALGDHAAADAQAPTEQTAAANATITLAGAAEAAEGYTFGGWNDGTTTYEAGAEYTVTGNVTMTAVWNVVHTHTYTWEVTAYPVESDGAATGTCSGCAEGTEGHTKPVTLPKVIGVDETGSNLIEGTVPESGAQVGKYYVTVTNPTCTADAGMAFFYVYDAETVIPFTYTVEGTALGHAYVVEYDSATMTSASWTATATCDRSGCGATHEFTNVPAVNSEDTDNWSETSKIDYDSQMPTCTTDGKTALAYKNAAPDGGVLIVKNVPIPALGHAYEISYEDGSVKADCLKCDSVYSATVTIGGGEDATGNTVLAAENFAFNAETQQFTVTLPENGYTYDGHTFSGWLVDGETYTEGKTVTVAAGEELSITAGWTQIATPTIDLEVSVESTDDTVTIPTSNGGSIGGAESNAPVCVGTTISYEVTVLNAEGATPSISYTLDNNQSVALTETSGEFKFEAAGTYVFTITAEGSGAADYEFTVIVTEHDYANGSKDVTTVPTATATGTLTITCKSCYPSAEGHSFEVELPTLTDVNVTSMAGGYRDTTYAATCEEAGSRQYTFIIPEQYGGGEIHVATVTLEQLEHSYGAATVDEATGNIIQTCANCPATQTLATLTGLSVGWAEGAQGWYTVGGTISVSDFDVTYTYEGDVAAYEDIIKAAITDNITQLSTAQTGLVTVTFTLGDTDASIDVMIYAANEENGAKVLSAQEGTVTSVKGTGYSVDAVDSAAADGISVSFWYTGYYDLVSDWHTVLLTNGSYTITLPNVGSRYPDWDGGTNWRNGGLYMNSTYENANSFVTVTFSADGNVSFYWNGVMRIQYVASETYADTMTVGDYVSGLLSAIASSGFTFGYGIVEEVVSGIAADDLFITAALTDAQVMALYAAYQSSAAFPIAKLDTAALLNGVTGVTVYASADRDFAANERYGLAANAGYTDGISISFNLTAMGAESWASIIIGSVVDLDVCLAVLDAHLNTADGLSEAMNIWSPTSGNQEYYMSATLGGLVTVTLGKDGSVAYYYYDGEAYTQVCYYAGTETMNLVDGATGGAITVSQFVSALLTNIAEYGCDLLEGVTASDLLVTSALTAKQATTLYNNYQNLNA